MLTIWDDPLIIYHLAVGDYKEGYYIGVEVPEDDPEADKPFYGPNVWPASSNLHVTLQKSTITCSI